MEEALNQPLFQGKHILLAPFDPERDAETLSRWTHDAEIMRPLDPGPVRPLTPGQIRKRFQQETEEPNRYQLMIRARSDNRLMGWAKLYGILWTHGVATLQLVIEDPADREGECGQEALDLVLRYAFDELNLHRLGAVAFEDNPGAVQIVERAGFEIEVRRREALHRNGRRWDAFHLGLLREEWRARQRQVKESAP